LKFRIQNTRGLTNCS